MPKSSIFMGFQILNHPFGLPPFMEPLYIYIYICIYIYMYVQIYIYIYMYIYIFVHTYIYIYVCPFFFQRISVSPQFAVQVIGRSAAAGLFIGLGVHGVHGDMADILEDTDEEALTTLSEARSGFPPWLGLMVHPSHCPSIIVYIYIYLGTPKGHNFSLKRKNRLLGSQAEISV